MEPQSPPDTIGRVPSPASGLKERLRGRAWMIAVLYATVAAAWIYFSDGILARLVSDPDVLMRLSVYKGLTFVGVTSLMLLVLVRSAFGTIEEGYLATRERERERRALQHEAERIGRLYAALSAVNQAIVRTQEDAALFQRVCDALVDHGGFRTVWVGWRNAATERVEPVARAGFDDGYLDVVEIYADERPEGAGPTGLAIRSGEPYICNDVASDPVTVAWREQALARGYRASGAFPIRVAGAVTGVLNVYAEQVDFFRAREVELLSEVAQDVTFALDTFTRDAARRAAEEAATRERDFSLAMTESLPGILYLYTEEGRFLRWNRSFERVSGYSGIEVADMHPLDFFAPEDHALLTERIGEVFRTGESFAEAPFLSKNGTRTPYFFTGRALDFEGERCLVGIGIDVSEKTRAEEKRREAERALRELNRTLEQKVDERTEELRTALVRAEAADHLKSSFLATMSHEFRTPLNSIIGFTGIVLQGLAGPLNAEQRKQLGMVQGSARHLLELINDVLDLSKIEAGQLELRREAFDLREVVVGTAETVRPLAEAKGLALDTRVAAGVTTIVGDRRRVRQVLLNLLNNGIKFTERGRVAVVVEQDDEHVILRVADTGIGIKSEDLETLFQPFRQIDSGLTRQHEGTGLGLAICRSLTQLMGGVIEVKSVWGEGSEFLVTLPLDERG